MNEKRETLLHDFLNAAGALAEEQLNSITESARRQVADTLAAGEVHLELRVNLENSDVELAAVPNGAERGVWLARVGVN